MLGINGKHRVLVKSWDQELANGVVDTKDADLAMTIGARLEGATHSHVRKALQV